MKQVLALVLALLLVLPMSSLGLAADDISADYFYDFEIYNFEDLDDDGNMKPGVTYKYTLESGDYDAPELAMSTSNFSLDVDWTSGSKYVRTCRLNGEYLIIELRDNVNTEDTNIEGTITLTARKNLRKRDEYYLVKGDTFTLEVSQVVADSFEDIEPTTRRDDVEYVDGEGASTIFRATKSGYVAFTAGERGFEALLSMRAGEKIYMNIDTSEISEVYDKYDTDYGVSYISFEKNPEIDRSATLSIEDDDYVYEWDGKKLTVVETTKKDGRYQWQVSRRLGTYVISDKKITAAAQTSGSSSKSSSSSSSSSSSQSSAGGGYNKNPDTGR